MRLIDADELKEVVFSKSDGMDDMWDTAGVLNLINNAPTIEYTFEEAFQKTVCEQRLYCPARLQGEQIAWEQGYECGKNEKRPQGEWIECAKSGMPLTEYGRMTGEKWYGFKCSRCKHIYKGNALVESPFCQKCGAEMKGGEKE